MIWIRRPELSVPTTVCSKQLRPSLEEKKEIKESLLIDENDMHGKDIYIGRSSQCQGRKLNQNQFKSSQADLSACNAGTTVAITVPHIIFINSCMHALLLPQSFTEYYSLPWTSIPLIARAHACTSIDLHSTVTTQVHCYFAFLWINVMPKSYS